MSNLWKSMKEWTGHSKKVDQELDRSRYSLVSCGELTDDTLQLWLGLPDEVKNDPSLASFRQFYENKRNINDERKPNTESKKRLPLVYSAPLLSNDLESLKEEVEFSGESSSKSEKNTEDKTSTKEDGRGARQSRSKKARYLTKMTILLACWLFFTVVFLMYGEKHEVSRNTAVTAGEVKQYFLPKAEGDLITVKLKLSGPFESSNTELKMNGTELKKAKRMEVWLERWTLKGVTEKNASAENLSDEQSSEPWTIILRENLDFNRGETRTAKLSLPTNSSGTLVIRMRSNAEHTVPFRISYTINPLDVTTGVIYACILLCGLYILIIFEVMNRTMAAIVVSTMSLAALSLAGERPSLTEVISWLDVETLLLLFSMMILVAIMAETGIFDFLAVFTFEVTKGKLWPLIYLLCIITAVMSTFLDNVTTVLLMSPVTIRLCEVMDLNPVPILMLMAIYSNIGGTATPVGDPPNVIVVSNKAVIASGINFINFTAHMALGAFLVCLQTSLQLRFMFRDSNQLRLSVPRDIQDLRHQISIWRRAVESLPHMSKDVHVVRERLERKIIKLTMKLDTMEKETSKRACPKDTFRSTLMELKGKYQIRDKKLLAKASIAIFFVVTMFFLHAIPELNRISLGWTALLGAILLLILADREDIEPILHRVEWSTLLFFAALFVLMEALSELGLILYIGSWMELLILQVDEEARLAVALMVILWVSGVISAFVDNIPLTTMMVRVVVAIGSNPALNLPLSPLIWALLFGACLGGNGTLIAASANVVCAGVAEQHGYKVTFGQFFKVGFPLMIGHLFVSSVYLLICHCVFFWH